MRRFPPSHDPPPQPSSGDRTMQRIGVIALVYLAGFSACIVVGLVH